MSDSAEVSSHPTGAALALDSSKFLSHLNAYPTLGALAGYAGSFPLVKALADHSVPILVSLGQTTKPLSHPLLSRIDRLGDNLLTQVDATFPVFKETTPQDVMEVAKRPLETIKSTTTMYKSAARNSIDQYVIDPVKSLTVSTASTLDSTTSPFLNPLLSPVNVRLQALAKDYHLVDYASVAASSQDSETTESSELSQLSQPSELTKTYNLSLQVFKHLRPNTTAIASSAKSHVNERVGSATSQVNAKVSQVKDLSSSAVSQVKGYSNATVAQFTDKVEIAKDLSNSAITHVREVYDENRNGSLVGSALATGKALANEGLQVANEYNKKAVDENAKKPLKESNLANKE
ncbi:hypothetical protein NADFUDRAFT_52711 [Nadsonia fulvescens var. elongata DSM 6958]|uniref:Uncharacterized protein n=1 Tax=Nadsonia fulvescens var. elongata DSM 6958 TaxID=857566 RepID=A0A1E3PHG0_9ASCO|nr:hypothetical protein NADFUDRAFT_52711 [Nadsonia fulvescens var. elongata DSM 6958]